MKIHRLRRHAAIASVAMLAGASALLAGCSSDGGASAGGGGEPAPSRTTSRTVTATATGTATGVPDQLSATIGISNDGSSAAEVLAENNAKAEALLDTVTAMGIDPKDVATTSVDLGPRFDDDGKITGYQANNLLRVTFKDLASAGAKLDQLVKTGGDASRVQGIVLGFDDDDALLSQARADAVKRAKAQATEMAEAGGATVGSVRTIADVEDQFVGGLEGQRAYPAADVASVPIAAGSQELTVRVKVVFELRS